MKHTFEDHPFWDFSLRVYGNPGVPEACIALQENRGVDVNVVLFCLWNGESGRGVLDPSELDAAVTATAAWNRDIVCEIRAVRNRIRDGMEPIPKGRSDALRKQILKIEIDCEHAEQLALGTAVDRPLKADVPDTKRADNAIENIISYFRRHGFTADGEDTEQMAIILFSAFPQIDRSEMKEKCAAAI